MGVFYYLLLLSCTMIPQAIARESIPAILTERKSPLEEREVRKFIRYITDGSMALHARELCSAANLFCGNNVDQSYRGWYGIRSENNRSVALERGPYDHGFWVSSEWVMDRAGSQGAHVTPWNGDEFVFFTQKDLATAKSLKLPSFVYRPSMTRAFLPSALSEQIPFSTERFGELLTAFGIDGESFLGIHMRDVVESCERLVVSDGPVAGPMRCARSLDSILEFVKSNVGESARGLTSLGLDEIRRGIPEDRRNLMVDVLGVENVRVGSGSTGRLLDCHELVFPYLVYGCHTVKSSKLFYVSLRNRDNGRVGKVLAACHMDTSSFGQHHVAFDLLHSRPGLTELCHWLPSGDNAWVPYV